MNVGELRKALEGVGDDVEVAIKDSEGGSDYGAYMVEGDAEVWKNASTDGFGATENDDEDLDDDDFDEDDHEEDDGETADVFVIAA